MTATSTTLETLPELCWQARKAAHEKRVARWIEPHQERAARQKGHPVYDFLFDYYSFRPGQLRRWHPGVGIAIQGEAAGSYLEIPCYVQTSVGVTADPALWKSERRKFARWLLAMLRATEGRTGHFGCFGMHEWAMVYRAPQVRHESWPLRMSAEEIARLVESQPPRCTHYDAFRFFTAEARPLNRWQLTRPLAAEFEQPSCLHANMDLYKWAYKLAPFTPSELIADTFVLALEIREADMRASPYDLSALDVRPIKIETSAGQAEYESLQRDFLQRAAPLRTRLISICEYLIGLWELNDSAPCRLN